MLSNVPLILRLHMKLFQGVGFCTISLDDKSQRRVLVGYVLRMWSISLLLTFSLLTLNTFTSPEPFLFSDDKFGYFNDSLKILMAQISMITIYGEAMFHRNELRTFLCIYRDLLRNHKSTENCNRLLGWSQHFKYFYAFQVIIVVEIVSDIIFVLESNMTYQVRLFWSMFTPYLYIIHLRYTYIVLHMEIIRYELIKLEEDLHLLVDYTKFATRIHVFDGFVEYLRGKVMEKQLIYQRIYEMFECFQKSFAYSLMAILLTVYVRIVVDTNFAYYNTQKRPTKVENILMLASVLEIPVFLLASKNCMDMVKRITYQLHNIISHLDRSTTISVQIQNFSLQILHQKIRINGLGIPTLDGYMLTRAVGSITTYMIFFIQFMPKFRNSNAINEKMN